MNMSMENIGFWGIILGVVGIGYAIYEDKKVRDTAGKIDLSLEDISKNAPVDIQQHVVDKAIERAIDREVRAAVAETAKAVRGDVQEEIQKEVRKAVDASYEELSKDVSDRISDQVANIDEYALKEKVTKEAEKKILKKFDGELDGVLGDFRHNLTVVRKIYGSINSALTGQKDDDDAYSFKLVRG